MLQILISRWVGGWFGRVVLALKKIVLLPANCKFDILLFFLKPLPKPPHRPTRKIENKVKKPTAEQGKINLNEKQENDDNVTCVEFSPWWL